MLHDTRLYKWLYNKQNSINAFLLLGIIIIEGFVSVAVEVLAMRQLAPFVGNSIIVTSLIIGIFLLFLAIGYWRGSLYTQNFYAILYRNFILAASFIGVGLSFPFISLFFAYFHAIFHYLLLTLLLYLLLALAPLVYFLGQTLPLTMNVVKQERLTGATGGKVLFLSTVGSFLGAILSTLLLMEIYGVAWTVVSAFVLIWLLTILLALAKSNESRHKITTIIGMTLLAGLVYFMNVDFAQKYFVKTTSYANYRVENLRYFESAYVLPFHKFTTTAKERVGKLLSINGSSSSFTDEKQRGFTYIEGIKNILFNELKLKEKNILVLGAGGFTLSAAGDEGNHFTYVDIDAKIKDVVVNHFNKSINGVFIAEDARTFMQYSAAQKYYDVVISDVYSNAYSIPSSLLTIEHLCNIKRALTEHGIAIFNIIAKPFLQDAYSKRVDNTLRSVFKNCMIIPINYSQDLTNIIYICRKNANELDDTVYTDNKSSVTLDFFNTSAGRKND